MPYVPLNRERLMRALRRLAELAHAQGLTLELSLYGGAVFTLVYRSRDATRDVDGIVRPAAAAQPLIATVAREQDLPDDWLNPHVEQFLSPHESKRAWTGADFGPGLRVTVPTAAYLLALKLRACRAPLPGYAGDEGDIRFLIEKTRPRSLAAVAASFEKFFPGDTLDDRAEALVKETLSTLKR